MVVGWGWCSTSQFAPCLRNLLGCLSPLDREGAGALCPDPLQVVVCFTSLAYFILKRALIVEPSLAVTVTL
jgi:hypothetical protein